MTTFDFFRWIPIQIESGIMQSTVMRINCTTPDRCASDLNAMLILQGSPESNFIPNVERRPTWMATTIHMQIMIIVVPLRFMMELYFSSSFPKKYLSIANRSIMYMVPYQDVTLKTNCIKQIADKGSAAVDQNPLIISKNKPSEARVWDAISEAIKWFVGDFLSSSEIHTTRMTSTLQSSDNVHCMSLIVRKTEFNTDPRMSFSLMISLLWYSSVVLRVDIVIKICVDCEV